MMRWCGVAACALALLAGSTVAIRGASDDRAFQATKKKFLQVVNAKNPTVRIEAVEKLSDEPSVEHARLLLEVALKSRFSDVHAAATSTLEKYKDDPAVCEHLLSLIETGVAALKPPKPGKAKTTKPKKSDVDFGVVAGPALLTLLFSDQEGVADRALSLVEKALDSSADGEILVGLMADELGERGGEADVAVLARLAEWKAVANSFPAQRAIAQALIASRKKESIDALLKVLGTADGQVKADIVEYLASISNQPPAKEAATWLKWWEGAKETFQFPAPQGLAQGMPRPMAGAAHYYGMPIYANRMVFVLDTSGSMVGDRILAAQRKLIQAVDSLNPKIEFTIVVFNKQVGVWQRKLVPATSENKLAAQAYVLQQSLGPATASFDALEVALGFPAEAMYFLTDGAPFGGKTDNVVEIVNIITKLNKTRRMSINSFGIGVGPVGNTFDTFLRQLSEKNYGVYRRVDQLEAE